MASLNRSIFINLSSQQLELYASDDCFRYPVSTALNGAGQKHDSGCTPIGRHAIFKKIGFGATPNTVFVGRQETGEMYSDILAINNPDRDWILTRVLWLSGLEEGFNRGGDVDTKSRFIYIHGCPDSIPLGVVGSAGCIRMRNKDVISLFDRVSEGDLVEIKE